MKRLLLSFSFLCLTFGCFAQQLAVKPSSTNNRGAISHNPVGVGSTIVSVPISGPGNNGPGSINGTITTPVSGWYNWSNGYDNSSGFDSAIYYNVYGTDPIYDLYQTFLYPDSSVKIASDYPSRGLYSIYNNTISAGSCFDPKAHFVFDPTYALTTTTPYTLDSISFNYFYTRNIDSLRDTLTGRGAYHEVVDTMIVQWYVLSETDSDFWESKFTATGNTTYFGAPRFSRTLLKGVNPAAYEVDIPLTSADANNGDTVYTKKSISTNHLSLPAGSVIAATVTYHPGSKIYDTTTHSYVLNRFGDTLAVSYQPTATTIKVTNQINSFQIDSHIDSIGSPFDEPGVSPNEPAIYDSFGLNNGIVAFVNTRYTYTSSPGYGIRYSQAFFQSLSTSANPPSLVPDFSYYITATIVTTEGINGKTVNNFGATLYPDPATNEATLTFSLTNPGMVNVEIYDIVGKKVQNVANGSMQAGKQQFTINTENLSSGMYFYTITVNGASETNKFTVSK